MFDFIDLPKGNGQTVFIDISLLEIKFAQLNFTDNMLKIEIPPSSVHMLLYQAFNDAFKLLAERGYKIIIDSSEIDENTFFFTPCVENWQELDAKKYHKELESKILLAMLPHGINKPITSQFDTLNQDRTLLLPFVIKNEEIHGGSAKFLIQTLEQLTKLKKFMEETIFGYLFSKYIVIQEYVETPTKYNTSLRVLVSSSGDILYATLKYAASEELEASSDAVTSDGITDILSNPNSPYFLGGKTFVSNTLAGGENILLEEKCYSEEEQEILIAHAIDPNNAIVPESIRLACREVMKKCGKELGAICGIDFIYDNKNKVWKYLENHDYPMLHSYAIKFQLPYKPTEIRSDEDIILDLIARMHSLSQTMKEKKSGIQSKQLIQET